MKRYQRMTAILLAFALSFSLLCPGAWAADLNEEDIPVSVSESEEEEASLKEELPEGSSEALPEMEETEEVEETEELPEAADESDLPEEAIPEPVPEESPAPLPESIGTADSEIPEAEEALLPETVIVSPGTSIQNGDLEHVVAAQEFAEELRSESPSPYSAFTNTDLVDSIAATCYSKLKAGTATSTSVTLNDSSGSTVYDAYSVVITNLSSYNLTYTDAAALTQAVTDSHPELFTYFAWGRIENSGIVTSLYLYFHKTIDTLSVAQAIPKYEAAVDAVVNMVDNSWTPLQKLLFVNDYFAAYGKYSDSGNYKYSAYDMLVNHEAVCQGYTLAATAVLNKLGIPVSYATSEAMNHIWNLVQLDGNWYHMDITWDDPGDYLGQAHHNFFLSSDTFSAHYNWDSLYECPSTAYDNAAWKSAITPFVRVGSKYYYFSILSSGYCYLCSCNTDMSGEAATSVNFYGYGTGLAYSGGKLYYNKQNALYSYDISSGTQTTLFTSGTMIYGSLLDHGTLYYQTGSNSITSRSTYDLSNNLKSAIVNLSLYTYSYSGSACTPSVTVNFMGDTLTEGIDYTLSYSNNVNAGTATVTVTGIGDYTGSISKNFTIVSVSLSTAEVTLSVTSVPYTGTACTPTAVVVLNGKTLTKDTDYTLAYANNINSGTATVTVTGKGNYSGSASQTFTITSVFLSTAEVTLSATSVPYSGSACTPTAVVVLNGKTLTKNMDYTLFYANNINPGTATVTVTGKGNYSGSVSKTFSITSASLSTAEVTLSVTSVPYIGSAYTPTAVVVLNGKTLTKDTDYTLTYANNINPGTATVTVTGKGNYTGSVSKTFSITSASLSAATVTLSATSVPYSGSACTPTAVVVLNGKTLTKDTDYTLAYANNINSGTATVTVTGKGNYSGSASQTFTITSVSLSTAEVTLSATSVPYSGSACTPTAVVVLNGKTLTKNTDYTLFYANNISLGTATIAVVGKGNYSGSVRKTFSITSASLSAATVTLSATSVPYTGSARTPTAVVVLNGKTLTKNTDYTLFYANNISLGTATIAVVGKGNYSGSVRKTFSIVCATPKVTMLVNTASGITIAWPKTPGASSYRIYRKTPSTGWIRLVNSTTATSYANTSVSAGGTYYYAVSCLNKAGAVVSSYTTSSPIRRLTQPALYQPTNTSSGVTLKWTKVVGAAGYRVYRKNGTLGWNLIRSVTGTSCIDTTAVNGVYYTYTVRACYGTHISSYSTTGRKILRLNSTHFSSISNVKSRKMVLKWTRNPSAGAYQIQYSTSKAFTSGVKTVTLTSNLSTTRTITGLLKGKTYYVRIRTYRSYGGATHYSAWSTVKSLKITK